MQPEAHLFDHLASRLARLFVEYSVSVRPGDKVVIEGTTDAEPLIRELYRRTVRAEGYPLLRISFPGQSYIFMKEATDA